MIFFHMINFQSEANCDKKLNLKVFPETNFKQNYNVTLKLIWKYLECNSFLIQNSVPGPINYFYTYSCPSPACTKN